MGNLEYLEITKSRGVDINRRKSIEFDCKISFGILREYSKVINQLVQCGDNIDEIESALGITLKEAHEKVSNLSQYIICAKAYMKTLCI